MNGEKLMYKNVKVTIPVPIGDSCNSNSVCRFLISGSGNAFYCSIFFVHLKNHNVNCMKCNECFTLMECQ